LNIVSYTRKEKNSSHFRHGFALSRTVIKKQLYKVLAVIGHRFNYWYLCNIRSIYT